MPWYLIDIDAAERARRHLDEVARKLTDARRPQEEAAARLLRQVHRAMSGISRPTHYAPATVSKGG